jgi:hypothetical protein
LSTARSFFLELPPWLCAQPRHRSSSFVLLDNQFSAPYSHAQGVLCFSFTCPSQVTPKFPLAKPLLSNIWMCSPIPS